MAKSKNSLILGSSSTGGKSGSENHRYATATTTNDSVGSLLIKSKDSRLLANSVEATADITFGNSTCDSKIIQGDQGSCFTKRGRKERVLKKLTEAHE